MLAHLLVEHEVRSPHTPPAPSLPSESNTFAHLPEVFELGLPSAPIQLPIPKCDVFAYQWFVN